MIVQESNISQDLHITPRNNDITVVSVYDEQTRETIDITPLSVTESQYTTIVSGVFPFKENCSYTLRFKNDGEEIQFFIRAFCTSQNPQSNQILDGEFIETISNNDFIIL